MIVCDTVFNASKYVAEGSVDLIILDPPYGIGDSKLSVKERQWSKSDESWDQFASVDEQYDFYANILDAVWPTLKPSGNIFAFGSFHNIYMLGELLQRRMSAKIVNSIVWQKENAFWNVTCSSLTESTEHIVWAAKDKSFYFDYERSKSFAGGKQLRNVWRSPLTPNKERVGHAHQKPLWLYKRIIHISSPPDGLVFDPMAGSGTACVACEAIGRRYVAIERNEGYFEMIKKRLQKAQQDSADILADN